MCSVHVAHLLGDDLGCFLTCNWITQTTQRISPLSTPSSTSKPIVD